MKISKRIVSSVICLAMLVTMIPAVFAESPAISVVAKDEAVNAVFSTDGFDGAQTIGGTTLTSAEMTDMGAENYALHMSSSSSKYQHGFASPYANVSGGQFSISYDLYVDSFTKPTSGSTTFLFISGKNNPIKSGGSQWMLNFYPFRITSASSDYVVWYNSDTRLYNKNWYHIIHYFDTYSGYRIDYIVDSEGNIRHQSINEAYGIAAIQYFTLSSNNSVDFYLDNITLKDESVKISSMPDAIDVSENLTFNVTLPEGFESALILADGNIIGNISPVSGKNSYDVTIPAGGLEIGNREIMVSASYSDYKANSSTSCVKVCKKTDAGIILKGSVLTTETENFNSLGSVSALDDGATMNGNTFYNKYLPNWMTANGSSNISRTTGASGAADDYALSIANANTLLQLSKGNQKVRMAEKGDFIIEFDLNITNGTTIQLDGVIPFWAASGNFIISGNKVNVAQNVLNPGSWYSFKMILDIDEAKWYCYLDDELIINGNDAATLINSVSTPVSVSDVAFDNVRFYCRSGSFAIDNLRVYNTIEDASITSASYDSTVVTGKAIPTSAKTLALTLSDTTIAPTTDDVELYVDGTMVAPVAVSTVDGVVTITLPALTAHTDLDVVIKNTVAGLNNNITETFYVTDANGSFFKSAGVVKSGDKIIGTIRHFGNANFEPIVASYNGKELSAVKSAEYSYSANNQHHAKLSGHTAYSIVITPDEADSAKVMAWDTLNSATPKVTAPLYNID